MHELERSNRELSEFSYAVSHDLQAPVRGVRALTKLLAQRTDSLTDDSAHLFSMIEEATSGMERLIESLLRYAQTGHGELERQSVSVDQIIQSVQKTLAPLIAETHAQIVHEGLPTVEADPVLLEQLLQNLVANALQYHRPDVTPVIEISGGKSRSVWQFAVKDNGQGIPSKHQGSCVFEPLEATPWQRHAGERLGFDFMPHNRSAARRADLG